MTGTATLTLSSKLRKRLGLKSALNRDYTVVMGILSIGVVIQLIGNIFSDMLYAAFDPRIREFRIGPRGLAIGEALDA